MSKARGYWFDCTPTKATNPFAAGAGNGADYPLRFYSAIGLVYGVQFYLDIVTQ